MSVTSLPEWQQLALYALGAAALLTLAFNLPHVGRFIRAAVSFAVLAFAVFLLLQQAPYDPRLAWLRSSLGLDRQQVSGDELRISMSGDGHFWANATLNGVTRRMLIDSGATVSALSSATATEAGVKPDDALVPVRVRTASGLVEARIATLETLSLGPLEARDLKVVVSPGLQGVDVLGMNFLSELGSWRVEGRTLILTPPAASPEP
ncbi:TIGR02281 family clan AA aspartic protease [Phenylobacterium sp. LH3H17]|uniref:retropepsin-like aspartic protease family protein n=1 Tax=Phenylobacterium sp. LH3H17 TaxID=2903901 RepID=UPI0020C9822D|nr:TIGR02281 family clan AA aspartic protease [Phenylobacterium sp. LH3H17]UTP40519.1 TIGR02281 family clan AA aspartic protease [Phenylobacterium sp. LH3H17]